MSLADVDDAAVIKEQSLIAKENSKGHIKSIIDTFKANHLFLVMLIITIASFTTIFILTIIFPNWNQDYSEVSWDGIWGHLGTACPPVVGHPLGLTIDGYDNLLVLIHAAKNSIIIGFAAAGIAVPIAIVIGTLGAYKGGIVDNIFTTITNVFIVFPVITLYMLIAATLGSQSTAIVIVLIGFLIWPWAARTIRSQVLSLKEREFVNLSRVTGTSGIRIAFTEILPNMLSYIILVFALETVIAIGTEASLAIIGVARADSVTLGHMMQDSLDWGFIPKQFYWLWLPPGLMLLYLVMLIYLLQASMPQIFNPRLREK